MTRVIRRIDPQSLANISGACLGALACVMAVPLVLIGLIGMVAGATGGDLQNAFPFVFAIVGGIVAPLVYALMGYLQGLIVAWIYNFFAGRLGGIAVEVE